MIDKISRFLQRIPIFKLFDEAVLTKIAEKISLCNIVSGQILIQEGDITDSFYIVMHGRLRAFVKNQKGELLAIGEIGQEEIVGEIGLLTNSRRNATIYAIRNSILLRFDEKTFAFIMQEYPEVALAIAKFSLKRLSISKNKIKKNTIITIAVLPAASNPLLPEFVNKFVKNMKDYGKILHLNSDHVQEIFKKDLNKSDSSLVSWLNTQEAKYRYVVYEADSELTDWTWSCIHQADQILLVGLSGEMSPLNKIEECLFADRKTLLPPIEFVLSHVKSANKISNTRQWLQHRTVKNYFQVRMDIKNDFDKLTRFVTGNARGLVLSGGGARAASHIGVLRAFEEANITFDIVAGSSMGAWIAGYYAMGMDYKNIFTVSEAAIKSYLKKIDYTFPFVSITGGKPLTHIIKNTFHGICIEDLWCRFFCVSTNLTQGLLHTHTTGLLWKSVRSSLSLPALLPPVVYNKKQLFVDGSVMNNLPVDIMREYMNGGTITASSLDPQMKNREYSDLNQLTSGWRLLWHKLNPYSKFKSFPNVGQIITSSVLLSSSRHQKKMLEVADKIIILNLDEFSLMGFKSYQAIIEKGYEIAINELSKKSY